MWFSREPPNWPELSLIEKEKNPLIKSYALANKLNNKNKEDKEELFAKGAKEELILEVYILSKLS